jgi:release factor glutamine methyltransferase
VYEPAEDTFQLLEALTIQPEDTVLELGTGCGLIALECARQGCSVICTDINPNAVKLTRKNIQQNRHLLKGTIEIRTGDLFTPIRKGESFSLIIFNLPYLPTSPDERIKGTGWFDIATDGGKDGLKVTKRFITELPKYLTKNGHVYIVYSTRSPRRTLEKYLINTGLKSEIITSNHYADETIEIHRLSFSKK